MDRLTLYDYLGFVIPGGLILVVAVYGHDGWDRAEPGTSASAGLVAAAFVLGYLNAALGNLAESLMLGQWKLDRADPLWGTLGARSTYSESQKKSMTEVLQDRYGHGDALGYRLAYTELSQTNRDGRLQILNQHIGFTRGMVTASFVCFFIEAGLILAGGSHLAGQLWLPGFAVATAAFVYRFRSFWRRFGDQVLRGAAVLHAADARAAGAEHEES